MRGLRLGGDRWGLIPAPYKMSRHYQFIFRRFDGVTPFSFVSGSPLAVGIFAWVVMWVVSLSSLLPLDWRSEHDRLDS